MKYFLWPLLRAAAVVLLPVITVSGIVRAVLRGLTGADQVPPRPMFFLLQLISLPLYIPTMLVYHVAVTAHLWIVYYDVKLGFASAEAGFALTSRFHPDLHVDPKIAYTEFLQRIHGSGGGQKGARSSSSAEIPKITRAEVLEALCHLNGMPTKQFQAASRLTQAEGELLTKNFLTGDLFFPITPTTSGEGIRRWLNDPLVRAVVVSVAFDPDTMESILRKVLQDDFKEYYHQAEAQSLRGWRDS